MTALAQPPAAHQVDAAAPPQIAAAQAGGLGGPGGPDGPGDAEAGVSGTTLIAATVACLLFAVGGHAVLWWAYANPDSAPRVPWQPVVGISVAAVAVIAFGGFYAASRRSRVGIGAGFLLTFLVLLTYALTIDQLPGADAPGAAGQLLADFRWVVVTIVASFFGTEAAVGVAKTRAVGQDTGSLAAVRRVDADLGAPGGQG